MWMFISLVQTLRCFPESWQMGIYNTVLLKDVVARKRISDIPLLESVIKFLFDNIGNIVSSKKIADSLNS
jgi:uncharacterized protein